MPKCGPKSFMQITFLQIPGPPGEISGLGPLNRSTRCLTTSALRSTPKRHLSGVSRKVSTFLAITSAVNGSRCGQPAVRRQRRVTSLGGLWFPPAGGLKNLPGGASVNHTHSTGIDPATGQLYVWSSGSGGRILAMNDNGSIANALKGGLGRKQQVCHAGVFVHSLYILQICRGRWLQRVQLG